MANFKEFIGGVIVGGIFIVVVGTPANEEISLSITKPANTMLPQFSWKRQNGEVVELKDSMEVNEQGVYKGGLDNMWKALMRKRPELGREFGDDIAKQKMRMERLTEVLDEATKRKP